MTDVIITPRNVVAAILLASAFVLGTAFAFQYVGGVEPCILCYYQRVPYAVTIVLGIVGLGLVRAGWSGAVPWLVLLAALAFAINAGIASFHVGVEQHWWQGLSACGAGAAAATTVEELRALLPEAPVVRCDEIPWSLFGISMAGYNVLASLGLAILSAYAAMMLYRGARAA